LLEHGEKAFVREFISPSVAGLCWRHQYGHREPC